MRERVIDACLEVGRDPATMRFSIAIHCVVGASHDEAMDKMRVIHTLRGQDQSFYDWFPSFTESRLVGSVDEIAETLLMQRRERTA